LFPISALRGKANFSQRVQLPRDQWKHFVIVNDLLTPREKKQFENQPVFMLGSNTEMWTTNRKAKMRRDRLTSAGTPPSELNPSILARLKQDLMGSREEDPQVAAARRFLQGT
jgi:hypothetical protein